MRVGLSTCAFVRQWQNVADTVLSLIDMIDQTADRDAARFQIHDYPQARGFSF